MSDRSDAAEAATTTAQALRRAASALDAGSLTSAGTALRDAAEAQERAAAVYQRAAPREPRPMQGRPLGVEEARRAQVRAARPPGEPSTPMRKGIG